MRRRGLTTAVLALLIAAAAIAVVGSAGASVKKATDGGDAGIIAPSGMVSGTATTVSTRPHLTPPAAPANAFINRPTMSLADYRAAKAAAAASQAAAPGKTAPQPFTTNTLQAHHELDGQNAAGEGGWFPPDINGAVGTSQFATITNSHLSVWSKSAPGNPALVCRDTINNFLGYSGGTAFDPRIEYDTRWSRWVFTTDLFPDSNGNQHLAIAISSSSNACGPYIVYLLGLGSTASNSFFLDYPQFSLSQDAVIVTYSAFANTGGGQTAVTFGVAKWILYNAQGFSVPLFGIGGGTLTPPNVIDANPRTHEILLQPGGSAYNVLVQNIANASYASVQSATPISGVLTSVPPQAPQPGACSATSCNVDTSDARFINDLTQYDIHLWGANTVALGSFSAPHWYDIWSEGPNKNTVNQGGYVFKSASSFDWNASIAALAGGRAIMTASWDDPSNSVNPSMWMTGRTAADAANAMNAPTNVVTSAHNLQGNYDPNFGAQRWGDTSSVRFDPGTARAFGFNETVSSDGNAWSSHEGVLSLS
jgi:hypothetical protein